MRRFPKVFPGGRHGREVVCALILIAGAGSASAEEALVAVAANFKDVIDRLEADFERRTEHVLEVTTGSTGQLYSQVVHGAPFDVLLAADQERPERLEREQHTVAGSRFTYAVGRLVLWSPDPEYIGADGAATLEQGGFRRLAIANPDVAPYGAAAIEVLEALELADTLRPRIVMGEDIGQTFAMIATGNAELGFVALSYVLSPQNERRGSRWDVPADLYSPILQDAVLLDHGADNAAAAAFMEFLQGDEARAVIEEFGYGLK
jgi:molybdate transport system substrate-binding protein